jgi:glycosyltransferase involved in cell wall biosynthesis
MQPTYRMSKAPTQSYKPVHVMVSDSGWILERLARELADRLTYVSYDTYTDGGAEIQYYMTYGCRQQRMSPIEIALFTHKEHVPAAAAKFEQVAREVEFCVAQSKATEKIMRADGVTRVQTIGPGVDLDRFTPMVRIGVVGRTYHTGRKGEALVAEVMDIPGIEWHFTGPGWPGPARHVPEEDLPAFYRSLDYVLVPALIEGGPMCVLEALACGCKVIGAPVGWVPEFPHVGFRLGDAADLRRVLLEVVDEKAALRRSVAGHTWDAWAQQHHLLFERLLGRDPRLDTTRSIHLPADASAAPSGGLRAVVAVHGAEMTSSLGGPSVRAPRTAAALRRIGVDAEFTADNDFPIADADVVHVLNVWHPAACEVLLQQIERNDRPAVLSPIFLDLSERPYFADGVRAALSKGSVDEVREALVTMRAELDRHRQTPMLEREPIPGYFSAVRRLTTYADHLILLSEHEGRQLRDIGVTHPSTSLVRNPVEAEVFAHGDPQLFAQRFGVADYVLCVGRVEPRKNQALLAFALRESGLPLVFIGHEPDRAYADLVRRWAGPNVVFAGRVEPNSALLASALAGARVFCLPSWSEGAPLVALEAAAAGCNMVLSNRSAEREYFGELSRYVDPADPDDILAQVMAAHREGRTPARAQQLQALVRAEHSWEGYARHTRDAYDAARRAWAIRKAAAAASPRTRRRLFLDLTTTAHHDGPPTGIARVEDRLCHELGNLVGAELGYVIWNSAFRRFIEIDRVHVEAGDIKSLRSGVGASLFRNPQDQTAFAEVAFEAGDLLVVLGGAWIRNPAYINDLWALKCAKEVTLVSTVYDVIQHKYQSLFPQGVGDEFGRHCQRLLQISDLVLTCSRRSARDIVDFCLQGKVPIPPIKVFRLGDEAASIDPQARLQSDLLAPLQPQPRFVLYVSSIDVRKNHRLLFELWRRLITDHGGNTPTLVLVGRVGWRGEEAMDLLSSDPVLQTRVVILQGVNDKTLDWLYQNCMFTVYPSLYEGWGLPVAESLRHGKVCIASDGGSLPEVAPGIVDYVNPLDFMGWYRALVQYCFSPGVLALRAERARAYVPTEWRAVAREVLSLIGQPPTRNRLPPVQTMVPVSFCDKPEPTVQAATDYMLGGWGKPEPKGTWTVGTRSVLGFQLDQRPSGPLALRLEAKAYSPLGDPVDVVVVANGATLTRWTVQAESSLIFAEIPVSVVDASRALRIELRLLNPRSPAHVGQSSDTRLLGLHVSSATFCAVTPLALDAWLELPPAALGEHVLRGPTAEPGAGYIALAIESERPAVIAVAVNGRPAATTTATGTGTCVSLVRHGIAVLGQADPFSLSLSAEAPAVPRLVRVGLFSRPPKEALEQALQRGSRSATVSATIPVAHVAYAGAAPSARFGELLRVERGSAALRGLAGGWHAPEDDGVWTNGGAATLYLRPAGAVHSAVTVQIEYVVYDWPLEAGARFKLLVGRGAAVPLTLPPIGMASAGPLRQEVLVAADQVLDERGEIALTLWSSGAVAPAEVGDSVDVRPLAIKLCSVTLRESAAVATAVDLVPGARWSADGSSAVAAFAGGWHGAEPDGAWSDGSMASLRVHIPAPVDGPVELALELTSFPGAAVDGPVAVSVRCDDVLLGSLAAPADGSARGNVLVPSAQIGPDGLVTLSFLGDRSARPVDTIGSADERHLSFKLQAITLLGAPMPSASIADAMSGS